MRLRIDHITRYDYSGAPEPVHLSPHTFRFRPRLDGSIDLVRYALMVEPRPVLSTEIFDAEGNPVTRCWFERPTRAMTIQLELDVLTYRANPFDYSLALGRDTVPARLPAEVVRRLPAAGLETDRAEPVVALAEEAAAAASGNVIGFLTTLNQLINERFATIHRDDGEPHEPAETIERGEGACRDLAVLFMHAARAMGLPARFVSGYAWAEDESERNELHAWAEVYLPGAGWRGFDPSVGLAVADRHVALAASVTPEHASTVSGAYAGEPGVATLSHAVNVIRVG